MDLVPIYVNIWKENDIWNISALDIGVVSFGNSLENARNNFEKDLNSHFKLLVDMGLAEATILRLNKLSL